MADILNSETAGEYVRNWHAGAGEAVTIISTMPDSIDGIPLMLVTAERGPGADPAYWTVWIEFGRLYGEW